MKSFKNLVIIHRGNYTYKYPENSIPAFKECIRNNQMIELDIHIIKDGTLVVFHDNDLIRMCNNEKCLKDLTYEELKKCKLLNTEYNIPTFNEVLQLVNGKVPLDIEIKNDVLNKNIEESILKLLEKYNGEYILKSFDPRIVRNLKKQRKKLKMKFDIGLLLVDNLCVVPFYLYALPDFISYNYKNSDKKVFMFLSKMKPTLLYTIKSKKEYDSIKNFNGGLIVEDFQSVFSDVNTKRYQ